MEPRPNAFFTTGPSAASATAARVAILARSGTMPGCYGLALADTNNFAAPWIVAQFNDLGRVKLIGTGSTTAKHEREALSWVASISGSQTTRRWFFAQAPAPEDEDQEAPENEEEAQAEPQRRNAPAARKQSSTEENAEQLREGGTINPPLP